jgi:hypothetical protein
MDKGLLREELWHVSVDAGPLRNRIWIQRITPPLLHFHPRIATVSLISRFSIHRLLLTDLPPLASEQDLAIAGHCAANWGIRADIYRRVVEMPVKESRKHIPSCCGNLFATEWSIQLAARIHRRADATPPWNTLYIQSMEKSPNVDKPPPRLARFP